MKNLMTWKVALALAVLFGTTSSGFAQYLIPVPQTVVTYSPPVYMPPPVMYTAPAPVVNYSFYPPVVPTTTVYSAPVAPAPVFAAPTVVYSAPAAVPVGVYTTRTYTGLGIFRPRGVYTQSYYTPFVR